MARSALSTALSPSPAAAGADRPRRRRGRGTYTRAEEFSSTVCSAADVEDGVAYTVVVDDTELATAGEFTGGGMGGGGPRGGFGG
jgi:hypothetical protein